MPLSWTIAPSTEGVITSEDVVYSTARTGGTLSVVTTGVQHEAGQALLGGNYDIFEFLLSFDTSVAAGQQIVAATLALWLTQDNSSTDFVVEARAWPFSSGGITTADYLPGGSMSGQTLLASLDTSGIGPGTTGEYKTFVSDAAFPAAINTSGLTDIVLCSSRTRTNTAPTGNEWTTWATVEGSHGAQLTILTGDPLRVNRSAVRW